MIMDTETVTAESLSEEWGAWLEETYDPDNERLEDRES
jgi:hypothetical protein